MKSGRILATTVLGFMAAFALYAQEEPTGSKKQALQLRAENVVVIGELGVIVTSEGDHLTVKAVLPKPQGQNETAADITTGDEVAMANGKRLHSIKELRELYESTPVGSECKLGVRRDSQPHFVTFVKKDAKDLPQRKIARKQGDDDHGDFFPALGIGITEQGADVVVSEVLPNAPKGIDKGDILKTLNGRTINKASTFSKEFDSTEIGGPLEIGLVRNGKPFTVKTSRPKPKVQILTR